MENVIQQLTDIAIELLTNKVWTASFNTALSKLGEAIDVSHVYVHEIRIASEGRYMATKKFSWMESVFSSQKWELFPSHCTLSSEFEKWTHGLREGNEILCDIDELPLSGNETIAHFGVRSVLIIPVFNNNQWWGIICCSKKADKVEWQYVQLCILKMIAAIIGSSLGKSSNDKALIEANELFRTFIDFAYDWEDWMLPDGTYRYISPACERITGYSPMEFMANPSQFLDIVHEEDRTLVENHLRRHLDSSSQPGSIDFRIASKTGEQRWINHQCQSIFMPNGIWAGSRASNRDITKRKKSEEEQNRLHQRLLQSQKFESLGLMAGGVAHDFNNILLGILGSSELALGKVSQTSSIRPLLETVIFSAQQAVGLTNQLLAYSGKGRFIIKNFDLSLVLEKMKGLLEASVSRVSQKASLKYCLPTGLPFIAADVSQVQQVALNLVINASEAIGTDRSGDIVVSTGARFCDHKFLGTNCIDACPNEGLYVFLQVSDTGCGMDQNTMLHILDPFFSKKFIGRGLGLSAVQGIIRGHKGALMVESTVGQGTTFTALFPASAQKGSSIEILGEEAPPDKCSKCVKILLIDDENIVRITTKKMLESIGFEVIVADGGPSGVKLFQENKDDIDCILLDLTMPEMSGMEALELLLEIRPDVPIILSSGYNEQDITQQFAGKGLASFIQKPYRLSLLQKVLNQTLNLSRNDLL